MSLKYTGVNLAGLEFGKGGTINDQYVLPGKEHYDYWGGNVGANTIRLPFTWERLQPQAYGELDGEYLSHLQESVAHAKANGMTILLDLHNYARYNGEVTDAGKLGDVWSKLADHFGGDPAVWFNLMNEPYEVDAGQWADVTQDVVNQLRAEGVDNKLLLSGTHWSGAHAWMSSGNAEAFADFTDPGNNYAFDVHQYLDGPSSGYDGKVVEGSGSTRLVDITNWAKEGGHQLFLGETGAADASVPGQEHAYNEAVKLLEFMDANAEQWLGFTLWGAGPWWGEDYVFHINPDGLESGAPGHNDIIQGLMGWMKPDESAPATDGGPDETVALYGTDDFETLSSDVFEDLPASAQGFESGEGAPLDLSELLNDVHALDGAIQAFVSGVQSGAETVVAAGVSGGSKPVSVEVFADTLANDLGSLLAMLEGSQLAA